MNTSRSYVRNGSHREDRTHSAADGVASEHALALQFVQDLQGGSHALESALGDDGLRSPQFFERGAYIDAPIQRGSRVTTVSVVFAYVEDDLTDEYTYAVAQKQNLFVKPCSDLRHFCLHLLLSLFSPPISVPLSLFLFEEFFG